MKIVNGKLVDGEAHHNCESCACSIDYIEPYVILGNIFLHTRCWSIVRHWLVKTLEATGHADVEVHPTEIFV